MQVSFSYLQSRQHSTVLGMLSCLYDCPGSTALTDGVAADCCFLCFVVFGWILCLEVTSADPVVLAIVVDRGG